MLRHLFNNYGMEWYAVMTNDTIQTFTDEQRSLLLMAADFSAKANDTPADVMQIAIDALRSIIVAEYYGNDTDLKLTNELLMRIRDIASKALAQIEAKIGETK